MQNETAPLTRNYWPRHIFAQAREFSSSGWVTLRPLVITPMMHRFKLPRWSRRDKSTANIPSAYFDMDLPDIYANELLHYRFGLPLWLPEPSPEWGPIKLADVGYIADGKFYRLFNASLPADDPSHERLGVPDGFEQLKDLETLAAEKVLDSGPLHSTTITQVKPGGSVSR